MRCRAVSILVMLALLPTVGGCRRGNGFDLQAISGKVTLDSRPVDHGTIQFAPLEKQGLLSGSAITAGEYHVPKGKGLPPGRYVVRISSALPGDASQPAAALGAPQPPLRERIPECYNSASRLRVEVKPGGENTFDFDLESTVAAK